MIGQNLYYLNNKKYCTTFSNLDTVLFELNSFYHTGNPRKLVFVEMDARREEAGTFARDGVLDNIRQKTPDSRVTVEWKNFDEADDITYLENSDKAILIFADDFDHLNVLGRYVAGLLKACNWWPTLSNEEHRDKAADFVDKIVEADWMFNYMKINPDLVDVPAYVKRMCDTHGIYANTFQNGANFSYDLLFYLNDYHTNASVQGLIREKFVIHSNTMAKDVMEHFTSRRHYMAYFLSVIDWMNANGYPVDKDAWVKETYLNLANKGQYTQAFYKMEEQWNRVKDDANFIAAHQSKADSTPDGWEYMDLYTEFKNAFPIVRKVIQQDYDMDNLSADIKLINTDVQFFSKRQNRIPYLIHKYPL
tara:strand:- start:323 stop:1411 length:1089 start_codon:yes stop_codon:yes gene_type:complete